MDLLSSFSIIFQLIFIEVILSIDNAAVLGMMVSVLPDHEPVPYPPRLRFLKSITQTLFGYQRTAALKVGLLGAYLGRAVMLLLAAWVTKFSILQVIGAIYLIRLAFENLARADQPGEEKVFAQLQKAAPFWMVVVQLNLADLVFSFDNVITAVSISNQFWVVMTGVAIGILIIRFAASIFTWLISKEPIFKTGAYIIVFNIGLEILLSHYFEMEFTSWQKFTISASTLISCLIYAHQKQFRFVTRPLFVWLGQGMGNLFELMEWALIPPKAAFNLVVSLAKSPFRYQFNH
jgi:tellurite resistance protein TerC